MKKTLFALLAISSIALGANVTITNSTTFGGSDHASDRLDFQFNDSANRTVTITTTSDATIAGTDGYGLGDAANVLNFDITGTLTVTGTFKGAGIKNNNFGTVNVVSTMTAPEITELIDDRSVMRDLVAVNVNSGFMQGLLNTKVSVTLNDAPYNMANGGMLAMVLTNGTTTYYSMDDVTVSLSDGYWDINNDAQAVVLDENTYYGYVKLTGTSGAAPRAIGFLAVAPEPATATLSLLALAGLAARRKRH